MSSPRTRLTVLISVVAAALAGLWWQASTNPRINFLPSHAPANWILYPTPPDTEMHLAVPVWTEFRREFVLPSPPVTATLELRAFKDFRLTVNGQELTNPASGEANWKRAVQFNLTALLKPGTNWLSVIVTNRTGPPALWAVLRNGTSTIVTDAAWGASLVGAVWQACGIAGQTRTLGAGHILAGGETATESYQRVRWLWGGGAVLITIGLLFGENLARRVQAIRRSCTSSRVGWFCAALAGICWLVLFANNLPQLPTLFGFDADGHTEYVRYVQERGRLPLANEGWQMYQPPLYYLLAVGVLELTGQRMGEPATLTLRALSGVIGAAHLLFLFLCLRRLFPARTAAHAAGLFFAASLPALLCVSQFISNEGLAAMLSCATFYFALRTVETSTPPAWNWCATGGALGLALLAKFSAVLLLPFVFGLLALHARKLDAPTVAAKWRGPMLALAACVAVCGWHYGRVWVRFGNPLVGSWSPESGFAWWQENGFTTANYFFSFGHALTSPLFSGFDSLGGGLFSTLAADGLCSGGTTMIFRPPWNFLLMVAGLWLALVPGALVLAGGARLVGRWVCGAKAENLLWPALLAGYGLAITAMTLRVPSYAQAKAVYGLSALLPMCVCLVTGLEWARSAGRFVHRLCLGGVALWMMNSVASFWIRDGTALAHESLAANHLVLDQPANALVEADRALQLAPHSAVAAGQRCTALRLLGRTDEARVQAESARAKHGLVASTWLELANLAVARGDYAGAAALAQETATQFPVDPLATHNAALWSFQAGQPDTTVSLARRALRIRFANHMLHYVLAKALAAQGHDADALGHLRLAVQLKSDWPTALNDLAWTLATHPAAEWRSGVEAVALAEHACELTRHQQPQMIGTLAAAYAEAGRFDDAVRTATKAMQAAEVAGLTPLAERNSALLKLYGAGRAYHEATVAGTVKP